MFTNNEIAITRRTIVALCNSHDGYMFETNRIERYNRSPGRLPFQKTLLISSYDSSKNGIDFFYKFLPYIDVSKDM